MIKLFFILSIILLFHCGIFAQGPQLMFERFSNAQLGDWVRCMYQDSRGFIWIGRAADLRRYDGYNIVSYESQPGDTTSLSGNFIQCIFEDHNGTLWIGTLSDGLNKYNRYTNTFTRYQHDDNNPFSISSNRINAIFEDKEQYLWIAAGNDLNRFDRETNRFTCYKQNTGMINAINENESGMIFITTSGGLFVFDRDQERFIPFGEYYSNEDPFKNKKTKIFCRDRNHNAWIGADGLYQFSERSRTVNHYLINASGGDPVRSNTIQAICDVGTFLWIGTEDGLYRFDKNEKHFTRFEHDPANYFSLFENNIFAILKDRSGCYWFSSYDKGINKRNSIRDCVKFYLPNPFDSRSIEDQIGAMCLSPSGKIWIGTRANGLFSFDKLTEKFRQYRHNPGDPNSLCDNWVHSVIEDTHGFVWIATGNGLNKFDPVTNRFIRYRNMSGDPNSLSHNRVQSLLETTDGSIYVGTDDGLNHIDPKSEKFTRYMPNPAVPTSISHQDILTLHEDTDLIIWIGTMGGGLNRFDPKTGQFRHYKNDPFNPYSISSNTVQAIYEFPFENRPTLWIGTQGGGLCRFDKKTEQFYTYSQKDGLPANRVVQIISDLKGNLWLATVENITRFNPYSLDIKIFEWSSEMPINPHTCVIDREGEIFFGGFHGMVRFFPDSLKDNTHVPQVVITEFNVNNQPVQVDTVLTEKKHLVLSYPENNLSFEFAALDYNRPEMNQYAYKMEGLDNDWVYTNARRRYAAYTYLDPGEYVFRIKASNNDGLWNEQGTSVHIIITPPWWKTSWAYTLYLFLGIGLLVGLWHFQTSRIKIRHQLEIEHIHAVKLHEIDRMRSRFFANISHEFRTPLTLILGPVEQMLSGKFRGNLQEQYQLILRNGRRLLRLINQLLDLSRLESGGMILQACEENIVKLIRRYVQAFESLAKRKGIHLTFEADRDTIPLFVDRDKIEKILNNLLSNAFKFTDEGGNIIVRCGIRKADLDGEQKLTKPGRPDRILQTEPMGQEPPAEILRSQPNFVCISVTDTGTGIPSDRLARIFDRFYQVDDSQKRRFEGTGIGLALTRELVELHHGEIYVQSDLNKGSVFTLLLPMGKDHLKGEELGYDRTDIITSDDIDEFEQDFSPAPSLSELQTVPSKAKLPLILIAEDNPDMRAYMRSHLDQFYSVIEAVNGEKGWNAAIRYIPDLIISDVMMPEMDGIEFCTRIKTDERTSHIPVILLTARVESGDKIEGLETGADDYVVKPFVAGELLARIRNLIQQRRKLRERFYRESGLMVNSLAPGSVDADFLKRLFNIIIDKLPDADFKIERLADEIGMSRMTLHRKIIGLSGQSPGHFVRMVRLKRAAELLKNKSVNISEIAFAVGFESPANFARNFRRQFGVSPSKYARQAN